MGAPVETSGGSPHAHLNAYFHVRAYAGLNNVRVDVVVENNWSFVSGPGNEGYTVDITIPGNTIASQTFTHYQQARWHQSYWWGSVPPV